MKFLLHRLAGEAVHVGGYLAGSLHAIKLDE